MSAEMEPLRPTVSREEATNTAIELLCARNLHQCLWLPERSYRPRTRVAYSTTSNFADERLPAILFHGPMFGSRYNALLIDKLAQSMLVRVICVDRPGMGGSTPVALDQRLETWLDTVPVLLNKLKVKHVSLISHSAGTIYLMNTLFHLRDILDPKAPFVAFFGPWVHNEQSNARLMTLASKVPTSLISSWSSVIQFMNTRVMPVSSWSGGIISSVASVFQSGNSSRAEEVSVRNAEETFGVDEQTAREIDKQTMKYLFTEGVAGANDKALFCLKRSAKPSMLWDRCDDYEKFVRSFVLKESLRRSRVDNPGRRLEVRLFFGESDIMIGEGGREYFEKIWSQPDVGKVARIESKVFAETDHDSVIIDIAKGGLREAFEEIRRIQN